MENIKPKRTYTKRKVNKKDSDQVVDSVSPKIEENENKIEDHEKFEDHERFPEIKNIEHPELKKQVWKILNGIF